MIPREVKDFCQNHTVPLEWAGKRSTSYTRVSVYIPEWLQKEYASSLVSHYNYLWYDTTNYTYWSHRVMGYWRRTSRIQLSSSSTFHLIRFLSLILVSLAVGVVHLSVIDTVLLFRFWQKIVWRKTRPWPVVCWWTPHSLHYRFEDYHVVHCVCIIMRTGLVTVWMVSDLQDEL